MVSASGKIAGRGPGLKVFALSCGFAVFLLVGCADMPVLQDEVFYPQVKQPSVTVKLLETKGRLAISSNGPFVIRCFPREGERSLYYASSEMLLQLSDDGIRLSQESQGELENSLHRVSFLPKEGDFWIYLNGRPYRGLLEVAAPTDTGSLLVLNLVYLEDYLKGVIPAEIGRLGVDEMEALKAQAVAARTYCLTRLGRYADRGYDLEATVADQVYSGVQAETQLANRAVELTTEEVMAHRGRLIKAYYHANSGGKTESVERVWDKPKQDYLIPVDDSDFCSWAENYQWRESWTKDALQINLQSFFATSVNQSNGRFGEVVNLRIRKRSASGRVEILDVVTDWGTYSVCRDKIRWALRKGSDSTSILPSTCFDLEIKRNGDGSLEQVIARGRGNGHGVGMCQIGAIGMARRGYSYQDILAFYYSGVELTRWN
jgi:stage II sporulation protein D